jgi:lipopolysaccharide export LptBFGC system permease protein LptF
LDTRISDAYRKGATDAVDRADRNAWNARSNTLYLVVLAVVAMPAIAMITSLDPQAFGSYIAPVTGIAGTVVGYWFGTLGRSGAEKAGS